MEPCGEQLGEGLQRGFGPGTAGLERQLLALRRAGFLDVFSGAAAAQEPDYRSFVERTGFNYLRDLDYALLSFHRTGTYFLVRGRFDWPRLENYARAQGGHCEGGLCNLEGSARDRRISFLPLRRDLMALAVSEDDAAAARLEASRPGPSLDIPRDPVWSLIPLAALRSAAGLPPDAGVFVRALGASDRILLALGPRGAALELRLDVTCRSAAAAAALAAQLREATARLRELLAREKQAPNARDLSGVLAAGAFEQKDLHVFGRWPLQRAFLEALARGI